jgi:(1->4)-alpha-D-glucan 1-alpha-D-glucosylmutase
VLTTRRELADVFRRGEYLSLAAQGQLAQHVIAFLRKLERQSVLVAVPRFACTLMRNNEKLPLGEAWGSEALLMPDDRGRSFEDVFTGERRTVSSEGTLRLSEVFERFPVAILRSTD